MNNIKLNKNKVMNKQERNIGIFSIGDFRKIYLSLWEFKHKNIKYKPYDFDFDPNYAKNIDLWYWKDSAVYELKIIYEFIKQKILTYKDRDIVDNLCSMHFLRFFFEDEEWIHIGDVAKYNWKLENFDRLQIKLLDGKTIFKNIYNLSEIKNFFKKINLLFFNNIEYEIKIEERIINDLKLIKIDHNIIDIFKRELELVENFIQNKDWNSVLNKIVKDIYFKIICDDILKLSKNKESINEEYLSRYIKNPIIVRRIISSLTDISFIRNSIIDVRNSKIKNLNKKNDKQDIHIAFNKQSTEKEKEVFIKFYLDSCKILWNLLLNLEIVKK